ncbi:MAG TPA: hypothetical protein VH475_17140 [Tepidisphaeraceae bacterium]|jgi:hypothetical protein
MTTQRQSGNGRWVVIVLVVLGLAAAIIELAFWRFPDTHKRLPPQGPLPATTTTTTTVTTTTPNPGGEAR